MAADGGRNRAGHRSRGVVRSGTAIGILAARTSRGAIRPDPDRPARSGILAARRGNLAPGTALEATGSAGRAPHGPRSDTRRVGGHIEPWAVGSGRFRSRGRARDFVTLPYGAMPTDDDVHIVEIDVPRDSLCDFGSAAQSGAATNDLVTADVLIGDDGAPRAFRLVEPTATPVALERQQSPLGARSPRP